MLIFSTSFCDNFFPNVQLLLESSQTSVNQQQTMLRTMWGYIVHHITELANKQVILWHFSEICKPAHFLTNCSTTAGFHNCPVVILCPPSVLPQDNMMAKVVSLSICFMSAIYCAQNRYSILKNSSNLWNSTLFWLKTSFHPLLWTSSGMTGSWKLSAYIRFGSLRSVKSVKTRGNWKPKKCWKC